MSAEIKHVVFDIGNVLINWDPELAYLEQIPDPGERTWFLENICNMAWNLEQDRGRNWIDAEDLLIREFPDHEENIRTYRKNWPMMIYSGIDESVEILKSLLANNHDVTMLTNFASDTLEIARAKYDFLNLSRGVTVSGEVKLIKPDVEIFLHHARTFNLTPANTLFIDDSEKNVAGAKKAGWNSVQFLNAKTLKVDLERFHVDH
ncbi:MAG: HAD family phosphatase [Hyphomicrobiales bacterium]|nr:HAD family phosphatase [Hyphomicrobiales bacterium]